MDRQQLDSVYRGFGRQTSATRLVAAIRHRATLAGVLPHCGGTRHPAVRGVAQHATVADRAIEVGPVILIVKGKADRALCCRCKRLYVPTPAESKSLAKPGRKPICSRCYRAVSAQIDEGQPVYLEYIS